MLDYLSPTKCALLVVDIQERLMPVIDGKDEVIKKSQLLIKTARTLQIPILATTQYGARIGNLVPEIVEELGDISPIDKMEFSCFANQGFQESAQKLPTDITDIIVCGVETHICIYRTVLGGLKSGYRMWVPVDAVSSRSPIHYQSGLERMREIGATIANSELIIYELLGKAGTPDFKVLLPFLK